MEEHGIKLDICTACGINCTGNGHDETKLIELDRDSKRFSPTALNPFSSPSLFTLLLLFCQAFCIQWRKVNDIKKKKFFDIRMHNTSAWNLIGLSEVLKSALVVL
ncbi:hypothetical protein PV326_007095 [Microctonus aethiopoides]|nr:hypothetical protein PV326_007095 [Microctonus aethiopoides]